MKVWTFIYSSRPILCHHTSNFSIKHDSNFFCVWHCMVFRVNASSVHFIEGSDSIISIKAPLTNQWTHCNGFKWFESLSWIKILTTEKIVLFKGLIRWSLTWQYHVTLIPWRLVAIWQQRQQVSEMSNIFIRFLLEILLIGFINNDQIAV